MSTLSLEQLYFGKDDAESDIARGGLLRQGFLRTKAYEAALQGTKTVIIGRKGSGKSAICLMLKATLEGSNRASLVTPDEISAEEIRRFQLAGIAPELSKHLIWRYIFSVQIAKYLITFAKGSPEHDAAKEVSELRRFLIDNGEVDDLSFTEKFWKVVERLKGSVSLEAFTIKLKTELEHPSPGVQTSDKLDLIEGRVLAAAKKLGFNEQSDPFYLLVDQIERIWSNDRESDSTVVGLFLASKHIRQKFDFVICTLFMRTDIYEKLQFADRDKFRGDEFHIDWDAPKLLELILARATASCGNSVTSKTLWKDVFPSSIAGEDVTTFLVGRTLMRPRDIIQFCNACRDKARTNGNNSIAEVDLKEALSLYSSWKLSDLQNEWMVNYPFLADLFVLFSNSTFLLRREAFEKTFSLIQKDLIARYPTLGSNVSADRVLSILYAIGFLGVVNGGTTRYFYQTTGERRIEPQDREFVIHPCFRDALQSTSAIDLTPFASTLDNFEIKRARFLAEDSPQFATQLFRGGRSQRGLSYSRSNLERLRRVVVKSSLPDEVRSEISDSVNAMEMDVSRAFDSGELTLIQITSERVFRHLTVLRRKLHDHQWLGQDKDLTYTLDEVCAEMERQQFGGELGEYAR